MTDRTDDKTQQARKQIAEDREAREKGAEHSDRMAKSKPTPTQEENDLVMLGVHIDEHEDDGSGPEPNPFELAMEGARRGQHQRSGGGEQRHGEQRHSEASSTRSNYATRTMTSTPKRE